MHILDSDDENNNDNYVQEIIHKKAQATTVLLASLCREEYNKVSGLDIAKEIWDTLKMELIEGELGRFAMKRDEEPTETYNRLKTLVNQIRSYRST